ncbi:MAG TPA: tetratricopeptide repeat protein [Candidatus Sulfotelmatobacter sp.]|nr:tetratricopeptide repeat protein [Candidatus Sulfotelmatobacter sp.]HWI56528.1 tetratricopeptide repeat protein [Bacillota bacterium]
MAIPFLGRWLRRSSNPAWHSTVEQRAAGPEDAESQFNLGQHLADVTAAVPDYAQAAAWYLKAAGQGHCAAQFQLGLLYGQGKGVARNEATAVTWLRQAAELGHAGAQYHVGVKLYRASKSKRLSAASECRIEALKWLQLATTQDYRGALSAREFVTLDMTWEEVDEGGRRAVAFAPGQAPSGGSSGE